MSLTEARQGGGRELEAEARQSELDVVCVVLISCTFHNAHVVVTCSCFVVNDINEKHYREVS